jgi:hypothetical protein
MLKFEIVIFHCRLQLNHLKIVLSSLLKINTIRWPGGENSQVHIWRRYRGKLEERGHMANLCLLLALQSSSHKIVKCIKPRLVVGFYLPGTNSHIS